MVILRGWGVLFLVVLLFGKVVGEAKGMRREEKAGREGERGKGEAGEGKGHGGSRGRGRREREREREKKEGREGKEEGRDEGRRKTWRLKRKARKSTVFPW